MRTSFWLLGLFIVSSAATAQAEWKEPKDGLYTDKQLTGYIGGMKEIVQTLKAAGKAVEGGQSGFAAMGVYARTDTKMKAAIAKTGMSEDEFQWVGSKAWDAWGSLMMQQVRDQMQAEMAKSAKNNQDQIKEKQDRLAAYEKAQKSGRRVMTKDDRDSAIKSAQEDQKSSLEEATEHAKEVKAAKEEADKADAEAKAADAAAKNPPKDVSADDRQGFIDEKKSAAESARGTAKDARERQAEAEKAEKESRTKAASAAARVKDPDAPATDEEKAQVKQQNEEMIKQLKEEIDLSQQALKLLKESTDQVQASFKDQETKTPPQNVAMLKKHQKEWEEIWGMDKKK